MIKMLNPSQFGYHVCEVRWRLPKFYRCNCCRIGSETIVDLNGRTFSPYVGFRDRVVGLLARFASFRRRVHGSDGKQKESQKWITGWHLRRTRDEPPKIGNFSLHARHALQIFTTVLLGAILSIVGWIIVLHWEERAIELEFGARANNVALTLQAGMDEYFKKISALRALFKSSEREVSRVEFDTFARELLKGQSAILSVSWISRVTRDERPLTNLPLFVTALLDTGSSP